MLLNPFLYEGDAEMARISSGSVITKRTKLLFSLLWLAVGSYLDITFAYGVSTGAFFSKEYEKGIIWPTIKAINSLFSIGLPIYNEEKLKEMAEEFAVYTKGEMKGCVTAIDGWVAKSGNLLKLKLEIQNVDTLFFL